MWGHNLFVCEICQEEDHGQDILTGWNSIQIRHEQPLITVENIKLTGCDLSVSWSTY
jgi:hypothetical protein